MRRSLSWQASKDRPAMHGLSPLCWRVAASRPRCRRLERSHLAAFEPRKDASDADTIATCSDPHAGEAITLRDLERVPNAFRRDQESPRVFPKLVEVRNIRKKVLRRNDRSVLALFRTFPSVITTSCTCSLREKLRADSSVLLASDSRSSKCDRVRLQLHHD